MCSLHFLSVALVSLHRFEIVTWFHLICFKLRLIGPDPSKPAQVCDLGTRERNTFRLDGAENADTAVCNIFNAKELCLIEQFSPIRKLYTHKYGIRMHSCDVTHFQTT